jgi:predicted nucleic acid-binding protein
MNILVDSFAWLELFQGSGKGKRFLQILKENRGGIYTSVLNLYEIRYRVEELKDAKTADKNKVKDEKDGGNRLSYPRLRKD